MLNGYTAKLMQNTRHLPVLLREVLEGLSPGEGETVLDATVGLGGHSAAFLRAIEEKGHLIAIDADSENLAEARQRLQSLPGRKTFEHCNFRELPDMALPHCDVIFADLGVSSPHYDDPERGFSFREDSPLDLRFDRESGETAAAFIARSTPGEMQRVLFRYGEVRQARALALRIAEQKPQTTKELSTCVEFVCKFRAKSVLPQVFQALRIAVNGELDALAVLLRHAPPLLKEEGRMGVISFHSLEDRMVKHAFRLLTTPERDGRTGAIATPARFELLTKKPIKAGEQEIAANPRARSARLRMIKRAF